MKARSKLIDQCRFYWDEFDPIGVIKGDNGGAKEYDSYLPHTAELFHSGADKHKITAHIENCVYVNMGFSRNASLDSEIEILAEKLFRLARK